MKLLALVLVLLCESAFCRNIVLLTSLPQGPKIERLFRKKTRDFAREHTIVVKHGADQEDLFRALTDPETLAFFWVSHGAYSKGDPSATVKPAPMLLDINKDNVAKAFGKIHPNVKFLGVIGCYSEQILSDTIKDRPDLDWYVPAKKVVGQFSLRRAIKHFRWTHHRKADVIQELPEPRVWVVKVKRRTPDPALRYKSLKVFVGGELLTVLPKMNGGEEGEFELRIPRKETYTRQELKIVFESGQDPFDSTDTIGELSLEPSLWRLFAGPGGKPFGTNERIFLKQP